MDTASCVLVLGSAWRVQGVPDSMCLHQTPLSTVLVLGNLEGGWGSGSAPLPAAGKIKGAARHEVVRISGAQQLYRTSQSVQCVEGGWTGGSVR